MGGGIVELELGAGVVAWTKSNVVGECIFECELSLRVSHTRG